MPHGGAVAALLSHSNKVVGLTLGLGGLGVQLDELESVYVLVLCGPAMKW